MRRNRNRNQPSRRNNRQVSRQQKAHRNYIPYILGQQADCTLKYFEFRTLTPDSSRFATYVYSLNGMYDPNITGTGTQPTGFDQLMLMYDHYCVRNCKVTARCSNTSTTTPRLVVLQVRDSLTTSSVYEDIMNNLRNPNRDTLTLGTITGDSSGTITKTVDIAKWLGRTSVFADSTLKGNASGNPAEGLFLHLSVLNMNSTDTTTSVDIAFGMEFNSTLIEPRATPES